jgi:hypothetical protein
MRAQSQAFIEFDNMWDFVTSNLPTDYDKAKEEAVKLNEQAEHDRATQRERQEEARQKVIEERKAKEANKASSKDKNVEKTEEKEEKKKDKKVEVKTIDKDGWVTRQVQTVKANGSSEPSADVTENEPEPEAPKGKKNKGKGKGKENSQNQKGGQQLQQQQQSSSKKAEEASKEYLDSNPFAAALEDQTGGPYFLSFLANLSNFYFTEKPDGKKQKGQQQQAQKKNPQQQQQPGQQKKSQQQPQPAQQKKQAQQNKNINKGQKEAKKAMKATKPVQARSNDWLAPVIVAGAVAVTIVLGYVFLIGA